MKKSLIMILSAALLMVGCTAELETKVDELTTRVENLEKQVEANKKAINELSKGGTTISSVEQTEAGWSVTLSDGKVLVLYNGKDGANGANGSNGKDGKDGDSFFNDVVVDGTNVVFTLSDGSTITVPLAVEAEKFGIQLLYNEVGAVKPSSTIEIPFRVIGGTAATKVYAIAGGEYFAEVKDETVVINTPATLAKQTVLVFADRGDGKSATVKIDIVEGVLNITATPTMAAYFWGQELSIPVATNVEVAFTTDVPWIELTKTKAVEEYTIKAKVLPTPSCQPRTGHIVAKDADGIAVQSIEVTQGGTSVLFLNNNTGYATWEDALAVLKEGKEINAEGYTMVVVSEDATLPVLDLRGIDGLKKVLVTKRGIGTPASDVAKCVIAGVITDGVDVTVDKMSIVAGESYKSATIYDNFSCVDMYDAANVTVTNSRVIVPDGTFVNGTVFATNSASTGALSVANTYINFGGQRGGQLWGGASVTFDSCTIENANAGYALRLYGSNVITLKNNMFNTPIVANLRDSWTGSYVLGDGTTDDNIYAATVTDIFTGKESVKPSGTNEGNVLINGVGFATLDAAIAHVSNGGVIELKEGEYDANVKVANGQNFTIQAAAGASRDKVIINGNIEIAGTVTVKDVTLATKAGVTNSTLTVKAGDDGYNWGHIYLARVEKGAKDVVFDNVHFVATTANDDFKSSMSMLWISQATNTLVKDCIFDTTEEGSYCPNQTHNADVVWVGNTFNGGGRKGWCIRVMDTCVMTIAGNAFESPIGIQIYDDFSGSLVLGDGVEDDNFYACEQALQSNVDKFDLLAKGVKIRPSNVLFNQPTTTGKVSHAVAGVWAITDPAVLDMANSRNIAGNAEGIYVPNTNDNKIYKFSPVDGSLLKTIEGPAEKIGHFFFDGAGVLSDGTVVFSNMALNDSQKFGVWVIDNDEVKLVAEFVNVKKDGAQPRLGDQIAVKGTKNDFVVYALDYAMGNYDNDRLYMFHVKDLAKVEAYEKCIYLAPGDSGKKRGGICVAAPYFDVDITADIAKGTCYVSNDDVVTNDCIFKMNGGGGTFAGFSNLALSVRETRTPVFFEVGGVKFMAILEMLGYGGSNSTGAKLHVIELTTGDLAVDLESPVEVATYDFPASATNGNACGSVNVFQNDGKTYFAVGVRGTGIAVAQFK